MPPSTSAKERAREVIDALPPDATIEDAIERLYFLAKVERGLADVLTLRALRAAGADLTKETEVNFYLYFPTREAAARAAESAATPDFSATLDEGADGKSWLCLVSGRTVPTETAIRAASTRLAALASSLGGEHDGWEAAVTS